MVVYVMDELNLIVPYSKMGKREARELVFMPYHMASLGTSSLLVGYHQDVNLGAHMLTLYGTIIDPHVWEQVSRRVYEMRWQDRYDSYDAWLTAFRARVGDRNIYEGRYLYSTLLPEDMEWQMGDARIERGILTEGTITKAIASGSPSSIGMVMYRSYGANECVSWLNASYEAMNIYLVRAGITLGISDIELPQELHDIIDNEVHNSLRDPSLTYDTSQIDDPVIRARKESKILQDLSNIRERVAKIIIDYLTDIHRVDASSVTLSDDLSLTPTQGPITINLYQGYVDIDGTRYSMGIYPTIIVTDREGDRHTYMYTLPHPLLMMIKSGARGNETNAIQISGIIGQQSYANGRIPRMMSNGTRTMPCYDFMENSPESRGHISASYKRGMTPADYAASHVAARENLTSNTDLTPKTGYFGRRLRVFMENLRISDKQLVTNERGVVVMWDFIMNPAHMFKIRGKRTFIDIPYTMANIQGTRTRDAAYVWVPYLPTMKRYLAVDKRIQDTIALYPDRDIILAIDPRVESDYPDVHEYLTTLLPGVKAITLSPSLPDRQREHWYLSLTEYDQVVVVPAAGGIPSGKVDVSLVGNHINISTAGIHGISYPSKSGALIPDSTLYQMMVMGTSFTHYPMVIRPDKEGYDMLRDTSFLETLILMGRLYAL